MVAVGKGRRPLFVILLIKNWVENYLIVDHYSLISLLLEHVNSRESVNSTQYISLRCY